MNRKPKTEKADCHKALSYIAKSMEKQKHHHEWETIFLDFFRILFVAFSVFWFSMDNKQFVLLCDIPKGLHIWTRLLFFFLLLLLSLVFNTQKTDFSLWFFFFPFSFSISPSSANNRHFFLAMEFYNVLVSVWDYMRIIISVLFTNADLLFIRSFSISHIYVCALYFR